MSEDNKKDEMKKEPAEKVPHTDDKGYHFDMYHFFSRKDVIAVIVFILLLVLFSVLYLLFDGSDAIT